MLSLTPKVAKILRWLAFLPTVFAAALAGLVGAALLGEAEGDPWLALPVASVGTGAGVYFGSRVAPSRRHLSIFLGAGLLLLFLLFLFLDDPQQVRRLVLSGVGGVALGSLMAWRRTGTEPLHVVRTTEGRSLRYKGTAPFQHNDIDRKTFFGRDREVRSLLSLVLAERLVVLFGKSGMGKSSLINAGLVEPLLERGHFPMTVRLADRARGLLGGLLDDVRTTAHAAGVEIVGGDESDLWTFFKTTEFWSRSNNLLQPVLILDQFEELFTLHAPGPRHDFIVQLAELVRGRGATGRLPAPAPSSAPGLDAGPSKLKIVLSLREDYLADLEELARDIPGILQHRFRIGALIAENARDAIVKPAALEHAAFETPPFAYQEDALQRILTFLARHRHGDETVKGDDVEPAQLQLVCQYVEDLVRIRPARRDAGTQVEVSEADLGGENQLQRVLEDFYDRTLASIDSPRERLRIRRLCERHLISGAGRRLTEAEEEIEKKHWVSKETLRQLVDTRLLRPEPRLGGVFYELSHDTLVEPILRSRRKRIARKRRVWVGTIALLVAYLAPWWVLTGRQNRARQQALDARQQALDLAATGLPDRNDPGQLLERAKGRLRVIEGQFRASLGSREGYAAMMFAAEDVGLRYAELSGEVRKLRNDITDQFNGQQGLKPVNPEEDPLNRRILIEGGSFQMGSPEGPEGVPEVLGVSDEKPRHRVTVSRFRIQEHEVTNAEYRRFDPSHDRSAPDDHPVVNVSWYDATAYAAWLGGSLPTEAQWEFAARGKNGRTYPWGEEAPTCDRANFFKCGTRLLAVKTGREGGKTPEGVYDLAGNVWEWCRDWFGPYPGQEQTDPLGPPTGSYRVSRGGSYGSYRLRVADRVNDHPLSRYGGHGFRVMWSAADGLN